MQHQIVSNNPVETDAMFDTSPKAMAERFGARVRQLLREGRDVRGTMRLAASYAFLADSSLRLIDREAWTVDIRGARYLTYLGAAAITRGLRAQVIH